MADAVTVRRRRGWLGKLGWVVLALVLLLLILYFVATSSAFFKGIVLPKLSKSINASVTVADASIHPFSRVDLHQVKIQTTGTEPLFTAPEIRITYHLGDILRGNYHVEEATIVSPTVEIVTNPDGSSNLDPLLKKNQPSPGQPPQPAKPSQPSKPQKIDIKKIALNNATVRIIKEYPGGGRDLTVLTNVNVNLDNLKNGETGKLALAANLALDNHPPIPGTNASLQASANGKFSFNLTSDAKLDAMNGNTRIAINKAAGGMSDLAGLDTDLACDITPTDIKQAVLKFKKGGANLGELRASGPLNMAAKEGHLELVVTSIDHRLLNLLGEQSGINFVSTTMSSTNQLDLAKGGTLITVKGYANATNMALTRKHDTTPTLDLHSDYDLIIDRSKNSALLQTLNLNGTQNQQPLVHASLTTPMALAWGGSSNTVGDSTLKLTVTNFNMADWKTFLGDVASAGNLNLNLNLLSKQGGKLLVLDLVSQIQNLTATLGSNQFRQADVNLQAHGQAQDLNQIDLSEYKFQVSQQGKPLLTISGSGQYALKTTNADMQVTFNANCAELFQAMGQPDINATSGTATFNGHLVRKQQNQTVIGNFTLADLTGHYKKNSFDNFGTTMDLDIAQNAGQLQINKAAGTISQNGHVGGRFEASGNYDSDKKTGQLTLNLVDLNENGLRPFVASALGSNKLVSVSVNSTTTAHYAAKGDSSLETDLQVANLVVRNPTNQMPASPLEAKLQFDSSMRNKIATVRQCLIALTPTSRAANQLNFTGQVDMTRTNAIKGALKLEAESLDLTRYYDLLGGKSAAAKNSQTGPQTAAAARPSTSTASTEPAPINPPLKNFHVDANVGRLYLHEVAITNFQTTVNIDGGHVLVKPFQLSLNGAPVNVTIDLDLGVPGYHYEFTLAAANVPVAPLANSFSPTFKGQAKGDLSANAQIKGTGITGATLQKNLSGQFNIVFTNANIKIVGDKGRRIIVPIAAALRLSELTKSTINSMTVDAKIGNGTINLTQFKAVGSAFIANSQGTITIANVLTNSPINNLPVDLSLPTSLAKKANLAPSNINTNAPYVNLGKVATVAGTIGDPKTKIDYAAISVLTAKSMVGIPGAVGKESGQILKGVGGIMEGQGSTNAPPPSTTSTNPPAANPFDFLHKVLPK